MQAVGFHQAQFRQFQIMIVHDLDVAVHTIRLVAVFGPPARLEFRETVLFLEEAVITIRKIRGCVKQTGAFGFFQERKFDFHYLNQIIHAEFGDERAAIFMARKLHSEQLIPKESVQPEIVFDGFLLSDGRVQFNFYPFQCHCDSPPFSLLSLCSLYHLRADNTQ